MSMDPEHRRRRRLIAVAALCLTCGLQLAALPPELFAGTLGGECAMACSLEGRSCCCKGAAGWPVAGDSPAAGADGSLAPLELSCRELCAAFAGRAPSGDVWLVIAANRGPDGPADSDRINHRSAAFLCPAHDDPSTLPRPPPLPAAFC